MRVVRSLRQSSRRISKVRAALRNSHSNNPHILTAAAVLKELNARTNHNALAAGVSLMTDPAMNRIDSILS